MILLCLASGRAAIGQQSGGVDHAARHRAAIAAAAASVPAGSPTATAIARLGDALLRAGSVQPAIESFEKAIAIERSLRPHLWQYGIALQFAGRHRDAQKLFEQHRTVNPHDVENAAWHFSCVA